MSFVFSLASVLRVREMLEEQEERLLQKILFEISRTHEAIAQIDAEVAESNALLRANINKPVIGLDVHTSYGQINSLRQDKIELNVRCGKLRELRDKQLLAFKAARRNREMLTDMREEKRTIYDIDQAKSEQKILDDNYINRRGRF
jgi:flagellar FliJ protein